ncbi:response regulator [Aquabacterium sp. G14]|uniref:response regulator n=1 Tax=Aquabacterium sp. G14 TaxID=3130164 RepID=UPI003099D0F8
MRPFLTKPTELQAPDSDLRSCKALIIDTNQTSRSILRSMLADLGLTGIIQASKVVEARRALETRSFDVVLCDYHFDDCGMTGADLLDDLRRAQLLPYSTVFVMVTSEASYVKVAEAAESALDCYLLKPHTANALAQRLHLARHRKVVLGPIFAALEAEEFEKAAELCLDRFADRGEYWVYAARIGGELLLRLNRFDEAKALFHAIDATKALPWARLGIARAQLDGGQPQPARRTLESLIAEHPTFTDAYDVMGRAQLQAGEFKEALETYKKAAEATPASIARLQKVGMLAFYLGDNSEAQRALERATSLGVSSKMYDYQTLVMLAQIRFDEKDYKGVQRCLDNVAHAYEKIPNSVRLKRMHGLINVLGLMLQRQVSDVVRIVKAMVLDAQQPDFDFEAAGNLLSLLVRLRTNELQLPEADDWVQKVAMRFCTSKASTDMLAMTVQQHAPYKDIVEQAYKTVLEMAEKALGHVRMGNPTAALKALVVHGSQTSNAKLLDLADMLLNRHRGDIADAAGMGGMLQDMRSKFCRHSTQVQLGAGTGREAGGLKLRA